MAPSLTSARARNRGATSSPAAADNHQYNNNNDSSDSEDRKKPSSSSSPQSHTHRKATPSYSSRPFGSSAHVPAASASVNATTSGWITSGSYTTTDKGKGKLGGSAGNAKSGNGPLRAYGGGLGAVGQGEFKLLVVVVMLASVVRLWKLDRPSSVVFDEVHFGGELGVSSCHVLLIVS
jgi:dolichyl-phosphate-mannose-protein mannosyltransferase